MNPISPSSGLIADFLNVSNAQVTGDYASTPANGIFSIAPAQTATRGAYYEIGAITIDMRLTSDIIVGNFGLSTALSTGIQIYCEKSGSTTRDLCPGNIKTNNDIEKYFSKENKLSNAAFMGPYRLFFGFLEPITLEAKLGEKPDKIIIKSTENLTAHFASSFLSFRACGKQGSI